MHAKVLPQVKRWCSVRAPLSWLMVMPTHSIVWPTMQGTTGPVLLAGLPRHEGISCRLLAGFPPADVCQSTTVRSPKCRGSPAMAFGRVVSSAGARGAPTGESYPATMSSPFCCCVGWQHHPSFVLGSTIEICLTLNELCYMPVVRLNQCSGVIRLVVAKVT